MRKLLFIPQERRVRDKDLDRAILRELIELRKDIKRMQEQIQQAFDDLNTKVTNIESEEQAAETLLQTLNDTLKNALNSSSDPTEVVSAVQAISNRLNTDAAGLAAAITANTPSAPAPSGGTTTPTPPATDPTA